MGVIALVSAKGSPGVTTTGLALALTWPGPVVLAECDPAGGDVLAGFFGGSVPTPQGLLGLAGALGRPAGVDVTARLVPLDTSEHRSVLPGIAGPAQAAGLSARWDALARALADLEVAGASADVFADCGRLGSAYAPVPLLRRADAVVLVLQSTLRSVQAASGWVSKLRDDLRAHGRGGDRLAMLLVGDGDPYAHRDIVKHLGLPSLGVLAWDQKAAAVLSDGTGSGRGLARSVLLRTARAVAARLSESVHADDQADHRRPDGAAPAAAQPEQQTRDVEEAVRHG